MIIGIISLFHYNHQVLTRDSVTISVDAVVYYRVSNSTLCKTSVENAHHSTMLLSQVAPSYIYHDHDYYRDDQNHHNIIASLISIAIIKIFFISSSSNS